MSISYDQKTWYNGEEGGTPITASELNRMEQGIADAVEAINEGGGGQGGGAHTNLDNIANTTTNSTKSFTTKTGMSTTLQSNYQCIDGTFVKLTAGKTYVSTDGVNWDEYNNNLSSFTGAEFVVGALVSSGNIDYVAIMNRSNNVKIWYSFDLTNWTIAHDLPNTSQTYSDDGYALDDSVYDFVDSTPFQIGNKLYCYISLTYNDNESNTQCISTTTSDTSYWSVETITPDISNFNGTFLSRMRKVGNNLLTIANVSGSDDRDIYQSSDGTTFTKVATLTLQSGESDYSPKKYMVHDGVYYYQTLTTIYYSNDLENWDYKYRGFTSSFINLLGFCGDVMVLSTEGNTKQLVYLSPDSNGIYHVEKTAAEIEEMDGCGIITLPNVSFGEWESSDLDTKDTVTGDMIGVDYVYATGNTSTTNIVKTFLATPFVNEVSLAANILGLGSGSGESSGGGNAELVMDKLNFADITTIGNVTVRDFSDYDKLGVVLNVTFADNVNQDFYGEMPIEDFKNGDTFLVGGTLRNGSLFYSSFGWLQYVSDTVITVKNLQNEEWTGTPKITKIYGIKANGSGGSSGGTGDYSDLTNKPSINGVELLGDKLVGLLSTDIRINAEKIGYSGTVSGANTAKAAIEALKSSIDNISVDADDVSYDNTTSGLSATDVQNAIDEVVDDMSHIDVNVCDLSKFTGKKLMIAHRGASYECPEQSLAAYNWAGKFKFDGAECDVQFTSDNVPILMHDSTVDRTTNGSGTVASLTASQITALTIDYAENASGLTYYPNEKVPTLEQYLKVCKYWGMFPVIEIKEVDLTIAKAQIIVDLVVKYGLLEDAIFIGWVQNNLLNLMSVDSRCKCMPLIDITQANVDWCVEHKMIGIDCDYTTNLTQSKVQLCHDNGLLVGMWTINDTTNAMTCNDYGVDMQTSNSIEFAFDCYNKPSWCDYDLSETHGITPTNEYEWECLALGKYLKRIYSNYGSYKYDVISSTSNPRAVLCRKFNISKNVKVSFSFPTNTRVTNVTLHGFYFNQNDNLSMAEDLGWFTTNKTSLYGVSKTYTQNVSEGFFYVGVQGATGLTYLELEKLYTGQTISVVNEFQTKVQASTTDISAGSTALATGDIYVVYE